MLSCLTLSFVEMPQASHRVSPRRITTDKKGEFFNSPFFVLHHLSPKSCIGSFLNKIVVNLYSEHNTAAKTRHKISDKERPYNLGAMQKPLKHKEESTNCHHKKSRQRNIIGFSGAYSPYRLRKKA